MAVVTVTTYTGGTAGRIERTTYAYGADGIRTSALHEVDATADLTYETTTRTDYLNDADNPTGYSQVVRETTTDVGTGQVQSTSVYTLGHDQVSQTTVPYAGGAPGTSATLVFSYDGHSSTRVLTDLAGAIATVAGVRQVFDYDAYGNLLRASQRGHSNSVRHEICAFSTPTILALKSRKQGFHKEAWHEICAFSTQVHLAVILAEPWEWQSVQQNL